MMRESVIVRLSDEGLSSDFRTRLVLIQNRKSKIQNSLVREEFRNKKWGNSPKKNGYQLKKR
jgi:hypothetical protein